jgi:hypothetical protein
VFPRPFFREAQRLVVLRPGGKGDVHVWPTVSTPIGVETAR